MKENTSKLFCYKQKYAPSAERMYLSFNVIKYYIKLKRRTKLKKNEYEKIEIIFISF